MCTCRSGLPQAVRLKWRLIWGHHLLQIGELPIESGMLTKSLDEAQRKVPIDI